MPSPPPGIASTGPSGWNVEIDPRDLLAEPLAARRAWYDATRAEVLALGRSLTVDEAETVLSRVGRNDAPAMLVDLMTLGRVDVAAVAAVLVGVWSGAEYPAVSLGTREWVGLFRRAAYPPPSAPLVVYRGAPPRYARGMSWTTDRDRAAWFAQRWTRHLAHVYTVTVDPAAVLADVDALEGDGGRREAEIVVDPSMLGRLSRA